MTKELTSRLFLILGLLSISAACNAQEIDLAIYKKIYNKADSLKKIGFTIDSLSLFKIAYDLDNNHPSEFFGASAEHLEKSEFNEASFLYYVGLMRYRYYNSTNPKYDPSEDGALLASFKDSLGELINMYLRTDVDNYINILKLIVKYYTSHDFKFESKNKDEEKYSIQVKSYYDAIKELELNKDKYTKVWKKERKSFEKELDMAIKQLKRMEKKHN